MRHRLEYLIVRALIAIVRVMPPALVDVCGSLLGGGFYAVDGLLLGAAYFAVASTIAVWQTLRRPDYAYAMA